MIRNTCGMGTDRNVFTVGMNENNALATDIFATAVNSS